MVHTVSLVPLLWRKHTRTYVYWQYKSRRNKSYCFLFQNSQITNKSRQIVPTPCGSILQPLEPPKCHIRQTNNRSVFFIFSYKFPINHTVACMLLICTGELNFHDFTPKWSERKPHGQNRVHKQIDEKCTMVMRNKSFIQ